MITSHSFNQKSKLINHTTIMKVGYHIDAYLNNIDNEEALPSCSMKERVNAHMMT